MRANRHRKSSYGAGGGRRRSASSGNARGGRRHVGGVALTAALLGAIVVGCRCRCTVASSSPPSSRSSIAISRARGGGGGGIGPSSDDDRTPPRGRRGTPPPPREGYNAPSRSGRGDDDIDVPYRRRDDYDYGHRRRPRMDARYHDDRYEGPDDARIDGGRRSSGWDDDNGAYYARRIGADDGAAASVPSRNDGYEGNGGVGGGDAISSGDIPPPPPPPRRVPPPPPSRFPPSGINSEGKATTTTTTTDRSSSFTTARDAAYQVHPADTERVPIHYVFPTAEAAAEERRGRGIGGAGGGSVATEDDDDGAPYLDVDVGDRYLEGERPRRRRGGSVENDDEEMRYRGASPRRDAVTTFMSTRGGATRVRIGGVAFGAAVGGFVGKSIVNDPLAMSMAMSTLLFVTGFLRNDYGELSRTLGLALVLVLQRATSVRREYPTLPHLRAMIRQGPRQPFPPVEDGGSPWRYEPTYRDDPEFKMTYALLAMSLIGSFCGGNVPILPAWMGGILGAATFASLTTGSNARGDLGRTMGMRLVGLVRVALDVNSELRVLGKAATVGGLVFDKVMIMDRKHRIKDKIVAICKWGYDKVSRTAEQVKEEMQDERPIRR